ncbi:IPO4 [Scenedesmus sp. PABB004]|nr:IPO4 [Scenedesmus sp. PABB004]
MAAAPDFEALLAACLSVDNAVGRASERSAAAAGAPPAAGPARRRPPTARARRLRRPQVRKAAEDGVRALAAQPAIVPELLQRTAGAADPQVRQLAAVLLRKWGARHWAALPGEVRSGAQELLLQRVACEPVHGVRRSLAGVVAAVASQAVPAGHWPGLLGFLQQAAAAESAEHREVGLLLFAALFETIGEHLQPHVPAILAALAAGAAHPSGLVQAAALSAVEPLLPFVSDAQVPDFHRLLAALLPCAQAALAAGNEELLVQLCMVLVEVAESPAPLLQPCLQQVLEMCMAVATRRDFEPATREQALHLLHWMAQFKPKQLTRLKPLLKAIVEALCEMAAEPAADDADDADDLPPAKVAAQALDALAVALNSQHVFPTAWHFVQAAAASPDPHRRAAGMMVCAVLSEGCAEPLRRRLGAALPLLLAGLADGAAPVRAAAAFALGQFAEYLQPEILGHYREVMPRVAGLLRDADAGVQERGCYALDTFCENLEASELLPYMPQLVETLLCVLAASRPAVQEMALSAVASIAAAAQGAFQPYAGAVLPVLDHFMRAPGKDLLLCRCRAVECAGLLVSALGPSDAVVGPHVGAMLELVLAGFAATDSPDLRDYSHAMFANVAKALGEGFAPWLPRVVPLAFASCAAEDGQADAGGGTDGASEGSDDSDDSDDSDGGGRAFNVRTGLMDEKVSATAALGGYAEACPAGFMPYAEEAGAVLRRMCAYWHDEARAAAYEALARLALAAHAAFPPPPGGGGLSPQAAALADAALPLLVAPVEDDVSKAAVAAAAGGVAALLKGLGPGAAAPGLLEGAANMAALLLEGKAVCQEVEDDDGDDDDDEAGAEDEELLTAAAELLPALAAAMGADAYAPVFLTLHAAPLLARLKPQQATALRAVASGAAAEVAEALGPRVAGVAPALMPLLLRELQSDDAINRQNAAYCAGLLVAAAPQAAAPFVQQLLAALHGLFGGDEAAGARDNAVGAVGRILAALPGALPLGQVLPVLLGALPLKEDLSETAPAVSALCKLLAEQLRDVEAHVPAIVAAFGAVAAQPGAPAAAKADAARALLRLQQAHPEQLAPLLAALPAEQQAALAAAAAHGS